MGTKTASSDLDAYQQSCFLKHLFLSSGFLRPRGDPRCWNIQHKSGITELADWGTQPPPLVQNPWLSSCVKDAFVSPILSGHIMSGWADSGAIAWIIA
ncbi:hypothetical protein TWF718_003053 [Orbilia javanica]|uniref:Uncharacterized protein n=1 Tax=Orbilia javanica TaxID=47235 RepID=A0AAN8MFJ4_9PEZI